MRAMLAVLFIGILGGPAAAAPFTDQHGQSWEIAVPSSRHLQTPYSGRMVPHYLPQAEVQRLCTEATGHAEPFGCAFVDPVECHIYVAQELPTVMRDYVHLHEAAHCRGWPADHPR